MKAIWAGKNRSGPLSQILCNLPLFMPTQEMLLFLKGLPQCWFALSWLQSNKLPRILPQERLESQALTVLPYLDDRVPKWGLHQIGSTGWFLRERETSREGCQECSEGQRSCRKHLICVPLGSKNPGEKLYVQHSICSQLTYGCFFNHFCKAISKGRIRFALKF